jgi:hypothetical protein
LRCEETYNALMPALERVPGSKLIGISTPYRKIGLLYRKWAESFGKADEDVLVVRGTSRQFNPLLSQGRIDRALKRDRAAAASEWLAEWRADVSDYIDRALVEELVDRGVRERVCERGKSCTAFSDEAEGRTLIQSRGQAHEIIFRMDPIRREPRIAPLVLTPSDVKNDTCITVYWPGRGEVAIFTNRTAAGDRCNSHRR